MVLVRMRPLFALLLLFPPFACSAGATPPPMPPVQPPMAVIQDSVSIQETTLENLDSVDVGVANMWERTYVDASGATRTALTARLDFELGGTTQRVVAGEGSVVKIGATSWEVVGLVKPAEGNGTITLKRKAP